MKIIDLLRKRNETGENAKIPTIVFFGDSVTQGCFEIYMDNGRITTVNDYCSVYHAQLAKILYRMYPNTSVNIVNAGISGGNAGKGLARIERDVLYFRPDLTVVGFGLNDCVKEAGGLSEYRANLHAIFTRLKDFGSEVIFLTPNRMNTRVNDQIQEPSLRAIAESCGKRQNNGVLDSYVETAINEAMSCGIPVCDVYAKWTLLAKAGVDTDVLLSNHINHPTREMHGLVAEMLFDTMLTAQE